MRTGISLYFASGYEANAKVVAKARAAGCHYAFTSLQIPEEEGIDYRTEARKLLELCRKAEINLIADVSPATLSKLGVQKFDELAELGITYVRLDFGFDAAETVELSHKFHVVFNASTITKDDVSAWRAAGADFTRFAACHNYYPKSYTGLSLERVAQINARLSALGFQIFSFVPGEVFRGPLYEGLPTVEEHRGLSGDALIQAMLALYDADSDVVLIGDPDVTDATWKRVGQLERNCIELKAKLEPDFEYLYGRRQTDRPDSSSYIIRSQESRLWKDAPVHEAKPSNWETVADGSILVSSKAYGRYAGELSIARGLLELDARDNIAGMICEEDRAFLPFIHSGRGFRFIRR